MPKTQIGEAVKQMKAEQLRQKIPEANPVADMLSRWMRGQQMTKADVGARLGITSQAVSSKMLQPLSKWTIADIVKYCDACNCPVSDALRVAEKQLS